MNALDVTSTRPPQTEVGGPPGGMTARVAWTAVGFVLALAAIGIWVSGQVQTEFQNSFASIPTHHRVFTGSVRRLVVDVDSGSVLIDRTTGSSTTVETTGTRSSDVPTDHERLVGTTLYLRSICGPPTRTVGGTIQPQGYPYCSRNFRVHVPGSVSVDANVETGNLVVDGMHGMVDATVTTGNVTVRDGIGSVDVKADVGNLAVYDEDGAVDTATGTGNVSLTDVRGPVDVSTTNGTVDITRASTSVHIQGGTSYVQATGLAGTTLTATLTNGPIELGFSAPPQEVDVSTQTGNVTIHVPYGSEQYQLDLHTGTGSVVRGLPSVRTSTRVIRALTENGNILVGVGAVTPPAGPSPPGPPVG